MPYFKTLIREMAVYSGRNDFYQGAVKMGVVAFPISLAGESRGEILQHRVPVIRQSGAVPGDPVIVVKNNDCAEAK